jgi:hypothetical protein
MTTEMTTECIRQNKPIIVELYNRNDTYTQPRSFATEEDCDAFIQTLQSKYQNNEKEKIVTLNKKIGHDIRNEKTTELTFCTMSTLGPFETEEECDTFLQALDPSVKGTIRGYYKGMEEVHYHHGYGILNGGKYGDKASYDWYLI